MAEQLRISQFDDYCKVSFTAMASPCEILFDSDDLAAIVPLGQQARAEALRIEHKFSRYREQNIVYRINHSSGATLEVDAETADLLDFAARLYTLSEGRFDITSGLLRRVWTFDGSDNIPSAAAVTALLPHIGWHRVHWQRPRLTLSAGMEIDLGGIGKEYAVDKVFDRLAGACDAALLVNFGGDLRARGPRRNQRPWQVGVEKRVATQTEQLQIMTGALATSGDSQRFLLKDGVRYSHILDPRSGWPVKNAPQAITVAAPTCIEAGFFASLGSMMGADAEAFLETQQVQFWSIR